MSENRAIISVTDSPQNEYWYHVSNQCEIPLAGELQSSVNLDLLMNFLERFPKDETLQKDFLLAELVSNNELVDLLRTLIGVSDKRMYLELSYLFSKKLRKNSELSISGDTPYNLCRHYLSFFKSLMNNRNREISHESVNLISEFLIQGGILSILNTFSKLSRQEISNITEKLILTKEVQQEEAKRRGHGAEAELAKLLHELGCHFIPEDKHLYPMRSNDPCVYKDDFRLTSAKEKDKTWSFDLIITDDKEIPYIFVQGLIHTSDPGQYGVNKSDETVIIKKSLDEYNKKNSDNKELWGLLDGVGFCENKKDTINKMLDQFDNFIQLKSLYKAALKLHKSGIVVIKGIRFDSTFYSPKDLKAMFQKYASCEIILVETEKEGKLLGKEIQAGKAWIYT